MNSSLIKVNDSDEDILEFAKILEPISQKLCGIEVLRYNNLASSKYNQLGKEYDDFGEPQSDEFLLEFCEKLENAISQKTKVFAML